MSIEYEIRDVLKIAIRKWYIILGIGLICAIASIPICERAYQTAMNHYIEIKAKKNMEPTIDYEGYIYIDGLKDSEEINNLTGDIITIAQRENKLGLGFIYYRSINAVQIVGKDVDKKECELFLDKLNSEINRILLSKMDKKVDIKFENLVTKKTTTNIGDILLKEPVKCESSIRVVGTAAMFGCLLGLAVVLIFDYVKNCRKILTENKTR